MSETVQSGPSSFCFYECFSLLLKNLNFGVAAAS